MRNLRTALVAIATAVALVACSDATPTQVASIPAPRPSADLFSSSTTTISTTPTQVVGVKRLQPLSQDVSTSVVIGVAGGWVDQPQTGAHLYVPAGTVSQPTTFTIRALAGSVLAYDFQPSGSKFTVPVTFVQEQRFVSATGIPRGVSLLNAKLGYFASDADVDASSGSATVSELRSTLVVSTPKLLYFPVWHFSGYIVCWD
jgi:hypothetical protein